jgi:hypothetical protein
VTSNYVTPIGPPGAPRKVTARGGNGSASVSFEAPANNGRRISGYTVTASPGGASATTATTSATIAGLANGTSYTFTVTATNALGTGKLSKSSNAVTPAGPPGAPTEVVALATSKGAAIVSFAAPPTNGAPIKSYAVTAYSSDGGLELSVGGSASPMVVAGLTSGKHYTFTVLATNSAGTGPESGHSNEVAIK